MALDRCQNFVSTQYLENKSTEFHQIIYMHALIMTTSRLGLLAVIFCFFVTELWPLIDVSEFCTCSISLDFPAQYL